MRQNAPLSVAILAAGKGTRMKSNLPKVLHKLGSLSLIERVIQNVSLLQPQRCLVVVGYGQEQVRGALVGYPVEFVEQPEQKGTGHAVQQLIPCLADFEGDLLVINADVPLLRTETLRSLIATHQSQKPSVTLLSARVGDPTGYGRVFCNHDNRVVEIVEDRDCTAAQRQNHRINAGIYCFHWPVLGEVLPQLKTDNQQQEYYLTDVIALLPEALALDVQDVQEIAGINDRLQLAEAYQILQERIKANWMAAGVTLVDPNSITIDDTVTLGVDVVIEPQTHLRGHTQIGEGCRIGPGSLIEHSQIGQHCQIFYSVVHESDIGDHTTVGPYAHIRHHSQINDHCRIGNFVETKNTRIGSRTNAAHLAYLGDATLGEEVNIGAGTIIANYDGITKHSTQIGKGSKTGANSVLVAPLIVGEQVTIAAGSTITENLPDDVLAIARARQVVKPGWRLGEGRTTGAGSSSASAYPAPSPSESVQIFVLRLHPHQDLKAELLKFIQQEGIQAGFMLTSVGSLRQATLRMAGATTNQVWRDTFEIVSLVGTLAPSGVHLHLLITDPSGQVRGGHLQAGCLIYTTAEMVIGESLRHRFERQRDEQTGYHELRPRFRS